MNVRDLAAIALLVAGTAIEVIAAIGVVAMRAALDRLHYVGLAGFGAFLVGAAVLVEESFSLIGDKAFATGLLMMAFGPVLVHATARSLQTRLREDWRDGIEDAERVDRR